MFDFYPLVYFDDYFVQMGWFNHQPRKNDKKSLIISVNFNG